MKPWIIGSTLGFGFGILACSNAQGPPSKLAVKKGWHLSYESGRAQAKKTGKPLMVVFRCEP